MEVASGGSKNYGKLFFLIVFVLGGLWLLNNWSSWLPTPPVMENLRGDAIARTHNYADDQAQPALDHIGAGDLKGYQELAAIQIQDKAGVNAINHPEDIIPACPGNPKSGPWGQSFDIGKCAVGKRIFAVLPDDQFEHVFMLTLDNQPVTDAGAVMLFRDNGFNEALPQGEGKWKLKGRVLFVNLGNGNHFEARQVE